MTQPAVMTSKGIVRCAYCRTDDYGLPEELLGEGHFSVRFKQCDRLRGKIVILLDGEDVTRDCMECLVGPDGWAVIYATNQAGQRYLCASGYNHPVAEKHWGRVVVQRRG